MSFNNLMTLEEILEVSVLYEGISSKEKVWEIINKYPNLREQFSKQITEGFSNQVREKGIYCIVNCDSWKHPVKEALYLGSIGFDRHPKIAFYI